MASWYEFIGHYGYFAIFILFALGIVGLPVPDEIGFDDTDGQSYSDSEGVNAFSEWS